MILWRGTRITKNRLTNGVYIYGPDGKRVLDGNGIVLWGAGGQMVGHYQISSNPDQTSMHEVDRYRYFRGKIVSKGPADYVSPVTDRLDSTAGATTHTGFSGPRIPG